MTPKQALARAVEIVGSQVKMAKGLNTDQPRIHHWLYRSKIGCPPQFAIPIEMLTEGQIKRWQLRPDIYPMPPGQRIPQ